MIKNKLPFFLLGMSFIILTRGDLIAQQEVNRARMKTSLINNFGQHIEWPQEDEIDTFRIGVYGLDQELMTQFHLLEDYTLKGKPVSVIHFERFNELFKTQILFVTRDKSNELLRITGRISGNNTLMVSDEARNKNLIMINILPMAKGKGDFEINSVKVNNEDLITTPDFSLLGGTEIVMEGLAKYSKPAWKTISGWREDFNSKNKQIEKLNQEIEIQKVFFEEQRKEIENQKEVIEEQMEGIESQKEVIKKQILQIRQQQEDMDARETELDDMSNEVVLKQQTLNSKIELIQKREEEISKQRKELEDGNSKLNKLNEKISKQEKKIERQKSELSNSEKKVSRRTTFLYIIIVFCILISGMVFFIYRGYRIKKDTNRKIEGKNKELEERQEEILTQSEEIHQANEEIMTTNEALESQKRELQYALENLKMTQSQLIQSEKMASVGVLTAGIAHELNNPINFVSGNVNPLQRDVNDLFLIIDKYEEIIKSKKLEEAFDEVNELKDNVDYTFVSKEIIDLLKGIEEGANRSGQIVKGLRSFSRLDNEKLEWHDIHEGIDSTLILLDSKIKNSIQIHKEYGDLKEIECLPSKINQVFMNILLNSIQAIEDDGEIFIHTISSEISVKIIIKDTGKGMTPEVRNHIFEPFYTTKDVGQGTGLGLSITYGIVEQHKGDIDVISEPGKGTEFIISLPVRQPD